MECEHDIIDADGHVVDQDKDLRNYLPAPWNEKDWTREYYLFPLTDGWMRGMSSRHKAEVPDAANWLSFLDESRIDQTILYPSNALFHGQIRNKGWAVAVAQAYNDWLYDCFGRQSDRLKGVALLPVQDIDAAVAELRRCVEDLGMVAGVIPSVMAPQVGLGGSRFDPLYAEAQRLDCPLAVHGGPASGLLDMFDSLAEARPLEHAMPQMVQIMSMINAGVYDRFPNLRVAYLECGTGWVPFMMDALDENWERRGRALAVKQRPATSSAAATSSSPARWTRRRCPTCWSGSAGTRCCGPRIIPTSGRARSSSTICRTSSRARTSARICVRRSCATTPNATTDSKAPAADDARPEKPTFRGARRTSDP